MAILCPAQGYPTPNFRSCFVKKTLKSESKDFGHFIVVNLKNIIPIKATQLMVKRFYSEN